MGTDYEKYKNGFLRLSVNTLIFVSVAFGAFYFWVERGSWGFNYMVVAPVLFFAPRLFFNHLAFHRYFSLRALKTLEAALPVFFVAEVLDATWLNVRVFYFDWIIHFMFGALLALLVFLVFIYFEKNTIFTTNRFQVFLWMIASGAAVALAWEFFEYISYPGLNLAMFGDPMVSLVADTLVDVVSGTFGSVLAGTLIFWQWPKAKLFFSR